MKTAKQINNAYDRAAKQARDSAKSSQAMYPAKGEHESASERGNAMCAAGFAAQALMHLQNGDYELFLTDLRLAGEFAGKGSNEFYERKADAASVIRAAKVGA